jgi:hypothetical protein
LPIKSGNATLHDAMQDHAHRHVWRVSSAPGGSISPLERQANADLSDPAVIDGMAEDVVDGSSQNGSTTMKRRIGFAEAESAGKKRVTRRQRFLSEMEKVVTWSRLLSVVEPYNLGHPPPRFRHERKATG